MQLNISGFSMITSRKVTNQGFIELQVLKLIKACVLIHFVHSWHFCRYVKGKGFFFFFFFKLGFTPRKA